jgi:hypothetical protein
MSALNLLHQHKVKHQRVKTPKQCEQQAHDDLLESFPLPRYFQVHFQHIHERTDNVHQELGELKMYVNKLEAKLDRLLMLLVHHQCDN